jgi:transcriptional regulator with XRE-family HTH domain
MVNTRTNTNESEADSKSNGQGQVKQRNYGGRSRWNPEPIEVFLKNQIHKAMEQRGITQLMLGKMLGKGLQTGHDVANMNSQMTYVRVAKLAQVFRLPISYFFPESDWEFTLENNLAAVLRELTDEEKKVVLTVATTFADAHVAEKLAKAKNKK